MVTGLMQKFEVTSGNYMPTTRYYAHSIISCMIINYLFAISPSPLEISVENFCDCKINVLISFYYTRVKNVSLSKCVSTVLDYRQCPVGKILLRLVHK
jgi:hypothetical protein